MVRLVVDNDTPQTVDQQRLGLIKKVHVARRSLGIEEDDYRALLKRVTGHESAKDCQRGELVAVMDEFARLGFQAKGLPSVRTPAGGFVARKARAMWISLHQLGAIDDPSERALEAFGRRQLGVERLQWADETQGYRLIEALKAIAQRSGWDQRTSSKLRAPDRILLLKDRLVAAQLAKLAGLGVAVTGPLADDRSGWAKQRLESAAAELGLRLRKAMPPT